MYRLREFKRLEELFFEYGEGMNWNGRDGMMEDINTNITVTKFLEALYEIEIAYVQLICTKEKDGTRTLESKRKGEEAPPERTSYDVGHGV